MKFVYDLLKIKASTPKETAQLLTMHTVEVDRVVNGIVAIGVITGKIIDVQQHPNADRLRVVTVDIASGMLDIVTGAPNVEVGQIVAVAPIGAQVLSIDHKIKSPVSSQAQLTTIKPSVLRGIESPGMICGADELGLSHVVDSTLYIFPNDTKIGVPIETVINSIGMIETDDKGTAHRPDLLSYRGIESELAAILDKPFDRVLPVLPNKIKNDQLSVQIQTGECTLLIAAKIDNVKHHKSPPWLTDFLTKNNINSVNLATDITNYVTLIEGHPTHVFDAEKVGNTLIARKAKPSENLVALNHKTYRLAPSDIVLGKHSVALDVAGVIGGIDSKVNDNTTSIVLTCAVFNPASIRHTSRRLGVRTDASARFERGLSYHSAINGFNHCLNLILNESGGELTALDTKTSPITVIPKIDFEPNEINAILGLSLSDSEQISILERLNYRMSSNIITPPWWRNDVLVTADVAEDIGRIYGYDQIPSASTRFANSTNGTTLMATINDLRHAAVRDLYEIVTPTMTSSVFEGAIEIANPIGNLRFVRQSLVTEVLRTAEYYSRQGNDKYNCFEIGRTYRLHNNNVIEKYRFTACVVGDPEIAKSTIGNILHRLHINTSKIHFTACPQTNSASVKYDAVAHINYEEILIGHLIVHNIRGTQFCVFKLYVDKLDEYRDHHPKYQSYSKFPCVNRDISIIVNQDVNAYDLQQSIEQLSQLHNLLDASPTMTLFSGLESISNQKAITIHLSFRSYERTLTDSEVNQLLQTIDSMLKTNYNATIR